MTESLGFVVRRDDLQQTKVLEEALEPGEGEALVRIDAFALTTNNITYAKTGEVLRYWQFWPAPAGWGRIPAWGFAEVLESRHPEARVGERLFGFWPMSTHALLKVGRGSADSLKEGSVHRRDLPSFYNQYRRAARSDAATEALEALFRPLFPTAFLLEDFLAANAFFGARRVLLISASGKTAVCLAHELSRRRGEVQVTGLTSAANAAFVAGLKLCHQVETYDAIARLPVEPTLYVDFAGNSAVREALHARLGGALTYACAVGMAHGEARPKGGGLPGPKPVFFFAPEYGKRRALDLGPQVLAERVEEAQRAFLDGAGKYVSIAQGRGAAALERAYGEVSGGRVPPERGHVLSLHE